MTTPSKLSEILERLIDDVQKRYISEGKIIKFNDIPYISLSPAEPQPDLLELNEAAINALYLSKLPKAMQYSKAINTKDAESYSTGWLDCLEDVKKALNE